MEHIAATIRSSLKIFLVGAGEFVPSAVSVKAFLPTKGVCAFYIGYCNEGVLKGTSGENLTDDVLLLLVEDLEEQRMADAPRSPPITRPTLRPSPWPSGSAIGPRADTARSPPMISPAEAPPMTRR